MDTVTVHASKTYDILIGGGLLASAGEYAKKAVGTGLAAIITDENVMPLYAEKLAKSLSDSGFSVHIKAFPAGENAKNADTLFSIIDFLAENNFTRTDTVFALGGGVVGDTAGLAAALYMRGIKLIQLPTSVVAAVDSSVGGKTAVDICKGKNLVGSFYQPDLVICDTSVFSTLPSEIYRDGFAEIIKYGMISDCDLLEKIGNEPEIDEIVTRCVTIKKNFVEQDEYDKGKRMLLNFGHTIGHAIECASDFSVSHGHAVALGMAAMTRASVRLGLCDEDTLLRLTKALRAYSLPLYSTIPTKRLFDAAMSDKKRSGDEITLIVPKRAGECVLYKASGSELRRFIELGFGERI